MGITDAVGEFELYLIGIKLLRKNTYKFYIRNLNEFINIARQNNIIEIYKIDKDIVNKYLSHLKQINNSKRTISLKITVLNEFFTFLSDKHNFHTLKISHPKFEHKLPTYFSENQISRIFSYLETYISPKDFRNKLMVKLTYSTGIRVDELINIKLYDVNLNERTLLVTGKGNKQRYLTFPVQVKDDLHIYISVKRNKIYKPLVNTDYLFFTFHGGKFKPFCRQSIWYIFKEIGHKLSIKIHPHKFRHSIATHFLNNGLNLRMIQKFLGHESISTTTIYTHLDLKNLRKHYNKNHIRS